MTTAVAHIISLVRGVQPAPCSLGLGTPEV